MLNILRFLASLEEDDGEEDYTRIPIIPALRTITDRKEFSIYEAILEPIVCDEGNHATILQHVYERLSFSGQSTGHS